MTLLKLEFHFIRPYWLLAIIPLVLIIFFLQRHTKKGGNWQQIIDAQLLNYLLLPASSIKNYWFLIILSLIWLLSIFALAGPAWEKRPQPLYRDQSAKIILLDLSEAMDTTDIQPNRITRAKYKVLDILKKYPAGQTGMAVFTAEAYTVSPLTNDTNTIALMVPDISANIMPVRGSNISNALLKAETLLQQNHAKTGTILLITASIADTAAIDIAAQIHAAGYTLSVLGVGSANDPVAPLPIKTLELLAAAGGGRFSSFTNTNKDINYLLAPTIQNTGIQQEKLLSSANLWIDEGRWFILLILPLVLIAFRRGWLPGADQ